MQPGLLPNDPAHRRRPTGSKMQTEALSRRPPKQAGFVFDSFVPVCGARVTWLADRACHRLADPTKRIGSPGGALRIKIACAYGFEDRPQVALARHRRIRLV